MTNRESPQPQPDPPQQRGPFQPTSNPQDSYQPASYQQVGPLQPAVPKQLPIPVWARPKISPMPAEPREYQQLLRGPKHHWWRPLLSLVLFAVFAGFGTILMYPALLLLGAASGKRNLMAWAEQQLLLDGPLSWQTFLVIALSLILLIPSAQLSTWIAHGIRPRYLASVSGGIRWRWLLRCLLVLLPLWGVYLGILTVFTDQFTGGAAREWLPLLLIAVFLIPFQAAGEEYAFRGWIQQNIGSWFGSRVLALIFPAIPAVGLFALAHGSPNFWVLADLGIFALAAVILVWRTGGLEAAIVLHAVNNVLLFILTITLGGFADAFVGAETKGSAAAVGITVVVHALAVTLVLWQAKRSGLQRRYQPEAVSAPITPPLGDLDRSVPSGSSSWPTGSPAGSALGR